MLLQRRREAVKEEGMSRDGEKNGDEKIAGEGELAEAPGHSSGSTPSVLAAATEP